MIDRKALLSDLIKQVKAVEIDLGKQVKAVPEVGGRLRGEYDRAFKLGRTAATWGSWLGERVTQVGVAWVLGSVFVRFCEDNKLIPEPYLAGTTAERRELAEARYADYVATGQDPTYRGWLERSFAELGAGQAGKLLFDERHNPLFQIPLSHDGARSLVDFWRERDEEGASLVHDFTDPLNADGTKGWDTRFLGDLYQDLSEAARKTYALLQTPEFVEEFILDRTMDPVVRELGASFGDLKMIDPTCGSGHFVLGAFRRLVRLWSERQPGRELHERVKAALDSVHGVDVNPFAVAIARFRLLMAAMAAANVHTLAAANKYEWPLHLAVGDSLIKARQTEFGIKGTKSDGELQFVLDGEAGDELAEFSYATEDLHEQEHKGILEQGRYHVVVGNPPYITVKDKKLNALYRDLYSACGGTYALSVPFAQRFFELAKAGAPEGLGYGMVGQITANSFMKREFGTKLIEEHFRHQVELSEVIDTSGAYIPGHGTPTVILVGRRRSWKEGRTATIRTVRSVQGEPAAPANGADGLVWNAIVDQIDKPGSISQWLSVGDLERERYFGTQPWMLADGGLELVEQVTTASRGTLKEAIESIGRTTNSGADDIYFLPDIATARRTGLQKNFRNLVAGEAVRDFTITETVQVANPYEDDSNEVPLPASHDLIKHFFWPGRTVLSNRIIFGKRIASRGPWYLHLENYTVKLKTPLTVSFAFVSTHNHFVLDRSGRLFKQSAPAIKLREGASEEDHLQLLGLLNSSTACFWLKQVSHAKGGSGLGRGIQSEAWQERYEFTGTSLEDFPLSSAYPTALSTSLDTLAQNLVTTSPSALTATGAPTAASLREARATWHSIRAQMIALQEELDWQVYSLYNLHPEDLRAPESDVPELALGQRAFEIALARRVEAGEASGEWFKRHNSTPITEIPAHWPDAYKQVVQKRIDAIESSRAIGMVERPEYKRRWATDGWDALQEKALRSWLLDKIEDRDLWFQDERPTLLTRAQLTNSLAANDDFVSVAALYAPRKELAAVVAELLADEHVPFLPALRYKPTGLKKRADWEHVWDRQRQEDAAPDEPAKRKIRDSIPVPPKYTSADFLKPSYWRARGKLDVPKERFISYATTTIPGAPDLFGWAGWDHQEQAFALVMHIATNPPSDEELIPYLAGLLELQPWLNQWHGDFEALYSGSPASYFAGQRATHRDRLGLTDDDLRAWRPAAPVRARRTTKGK